MRLAKPRPRVVVAPGFPLHMGMREWAAGKPLAAGPLTTQRVAPDTPLRSAPRHASPRQSGAGSREQSREPLWSRAIPRAKANSPVRPVERRGDAALLDSPVVEYGRVKLDGSINAACSHRYRPAQDIAAEWGFAYRAQARLCACDGEFTVILGTHTARWRPNATSQRTSTVSEPPNRGSICPKALLRNRELRRIT